MYFGRLLKPLFMRKLAKLAGRSIAVALVYTLSNTVIGGLVMQGSQSTKALPANPLLMLATTLLSGFLIGLTLGPLAARLRTTRRRSILIWSTIVFLNMASVVIEGFFFAPGLLPAALVPRVLLLHFFTAVITAATLGFVFPGQRPVLEVEAVKRSPLSWSGRFALSVGSYLLFYYLFGALNYALVTGPYYSAHPGLAVPPAGTIVLFATARAVLIVLSITPLLLSLQASRRRAMVSCGMVLFVIGGVVPLLMQAGALPPVLLAASAAEIFFQNFLTGAVAAALLGRYSAPLTRESPLPLPVVVPAPGTPKQL